ncbi:tetratricopeptide repeat protein, partial [Brasilonema sp. CT11]|nr:tetratricopeptide repeat protein [Brasilonema sp. CT11]
MLASSASISRVRSGTPVSYDMMGRVCEGVGFRNWRAYLTLSVPQIPEFSETASIQESAKPVYHIPYFPAINFVGREEELQTIHQAFQSSTKPVAISAVAGMGGLGKTQLAIQYAYQHQADYPGGVCWFNARESDLATELIYHVQERLNLKVPQQIQERPRTLAQQVEWCWQHWKPPEGLVLVVLDDVTDMAIAKKVLPRTNVHRFRFLITTRVQNLELESVKKIPLLVLLPKDALKLLNNILGPRDTRIKEELQAAHHLCRRLGYLPLGLELVGYYLVNDPDYISLAEMLERLEARGLTDEEFKRDQATLSPAELGVMKAFELSWEEFDAPARLVGCLLSLFNPDEIPWKLVEFVSDALGWKKTDVDKAKKQLYKLHFFQRLEKKGGYCQIHPLIRDFLHIELERLEQAGDIKRAFVKTFVAIAQVIPHSPTQEFIELVEDAIPHLTDLTKNLTDAVEDEDLLEIFAGLIRFYSGQGLYAAAERVQKQGLSVIRLRLGEDHPDVATSYNNLAGLYDSQGRYTEAEPLYLKALELRQRLLGEDHPSVATSYNNLAALYNSQGRYTEAEPLYRKALELRQRLLGEDHPSVAASYNNLAGLYDSQGRYTEAEPLYLKALELRQRLLGEDHPDVATSYNNLAGLYYSQGRYTEAEPLYQKALELCQRLLGEDHPDVATSYNN